MQQVQTLSIDGLGSLAYRLRQGTTPALVIIHGLAGSSIEEYAPLFSDPRLEGRALVALDLFGFGHSDKPEHFGYSLHDHAEAVEQALSQLGLEKVVLLGHSLGGSIGVVFAEKYPQRLAGLILAEGGLELRYLTLARWAGRQREHEFPAQFEILRNSPPGDLLGGFSAQPTLHMTTATAFYRSSRGLLDETKGNTFTERFFRLSVPKEYWIGEHSLTRWGRAFADALDQQGISWRLIDKAGHQLVLDNPACFAEAVALCAFGREG